MLKLIKSESSLLKDIKQESGLQQQQPQQHQQQQHPMQHPKEQQSPIGVYPGMYQRHGLGVPPPSHQMSRDEEIRR